MQQHLLVSVAQETDSEVVNAIIRWLVAFVGPFTIVAPPPAGFASSAELVSGKSASDKNAIINATRLVQLSQLNESQRITFVHESNLAMKVRHSSAVGGARSAWCAVASLTQCAAPVYCPPSTASRRHVCWQHGTTPTSTCERSGHAGEAHGRAGGSTG